MILFNWLILLVLHNGFCRFNFGNKNVTTANFVSLSDLLHFRREKHQHVQNSCPNTLVKKKVENTQVSWMQNMAALYQICKIVSPTTCCTFTH